MTKPILPANIGIIVIFCRLLTDLQSRCMKVSARPKFIKTATDTTFGAT